jgi:tetratricopeptide (TPR) repeat protein
MLAPWVVWLISVAARGGTDTAEHLARQGRLDEAAAEVKRVIDATPGDLVAQELYVDLLLSLGMAPRAVEHARAWTARTPTEPDAWYLLGRASPDATRSREAYETALRFEPAHARSHMGMGALYEAAGDPAAADGAYGRALSEDRSLSEAWVGRIRLAARAGRTLDARALAEQGVAAVPGDPSLALLLAELAPDRASSVLAATIERTGDDPRLHAALAERLLEDGQAEPALAAANRALEMDPSDPVAGRVELFGRELADRRIDLPGLQSLLSLRRTEAKDPAAALRSYASLAERHPRSSLVLLGRAALEEQLQDRAGSLRDLRAAAELDPGNVEAAAAAGLALLDADHPGEAEPLLSQASMARPWDRSLLLARWKALVQIGRTADALQVIEPLAALHRFDPSIQAAYAGSLAEAGRTTEAYRVLKTALVLVPDPRLAAAFVQIAPAAGHADEAAALLEQIVAKTGNPQLADAAKRLRAAAPAP